MMRCRCGNKLENQRLKYADYCKECNRQIIASLDISTAKITTDSDAFVGTVPNVDYDLNDDSLLDDDLWNKD